MDQDIDQILIPRERIAQRVQELANEISQTYERLEANELTIVAILSGSIIFLADLIRLLPMRMKMGLITVSSYPGAATKSQGATLLDDLNINLVNQHVIIIDDILDTGGTLRLVKDKLSAGHPQSIRTCVLLRKPSKAPPDLQADFIGFDIEDFFVVGYGLDYNDHYRNFPDIGVLRNELYAESPMTGKS